MRRGDRSAPRLIASATSWRCTVTDRGASTPILTASPLSDLSPPAPPAAFAAVESMDEETATVLARLGVMVIDRGPEDLPPALADHYLSLKSRGLL